MNGTGKMIAIDLDDTLLHDDISLSDYTKDILRKVMEEISASLLPRAVCFRLPAHGGKPSVLEMCR